MVGGSYSPSQLFLALCVATGLAAGCVLLATAEPLLASTPAELRGGSPASRRLSRGANRDSSGRSPTLRRLSGAAKGRRKADGPPPAGITVSYTPEEGYRSQEGQDKWVDQQIFGGKRCLSMVTVARAATRCPRSPPAGSGLLPGPERRAPAAWMPKRGCSGVLEPAPKSPTSLPLTVQVATRGARRASARAQGAGAGCRRRACRVLQRRR